MYLIMGWFTNVSNFRDITKYLFIYLFIYFQAAVSALLAVSVSYIEKKSK